jgi:hypothetical protein
MTEKQIQMYIDLMITVLDHAQDMRGDGPLSNELLKAIGIMMQDVYSRVRGHQSPKDIECIIRQLMTGDFNDPDAHYNPNIH